MSTTPGVETGEEHVAEGGATLTEPEKELLREELKKVSAALRLGTRV